MKILIYSFFAATLLASEAKAQSQYVFDPSPSVSYNTIPFNSSMNCRQWIYYPSNFPNMPAGNITKIYIKANGQPSPYFPLLQIKMGNTSLNNFTTGPFATGLTTVYMGAYSATADANGWLTINLQTPFYYDGQQNFIVECAQVGYAPGFSVFQANSNLPGMAGRSLLGYMTSTTGNVQNALGVISFEVQSQQNPLSVKLENISVDRGEGKNVIAWSVYGEENIDRYEIERSVDGNIFEHIGDEYAIGDEDERLQYNFPDYDRVAAQTIYYRLKIVEMDGSHTYSKVVVLRSMEVSDLMNLTASPIPFSNELDIMINTKEAGNLSFDIRDVTGRIVKNQQYFIQGGSNRVSVPDVSQLAGGVYFVTAQLNGTEQTLKILKN